MPNKSDLNPESDSAPKIRISPIKIVLSVLLVAAFLYLVFVVLLPNIIDYSEVRETLNGLTSTQIAALLALGTARLIASGWTYVPTLKGLKLWQATYAYTTSTAWANVIPIPLAVPIRWKMYVSWGFKTPKIILSFPLSGFFSFLVQLALPVIALGALIVSGSGDTWVYWLFGIGLTALVVLLGVVIAMLRSEPFTEKLANWTEVAVTWTASKVNKKIDYDFMAQAKDLRAAALEIVGNRWVEALFAVLVAQTIQFAILVLSLRMVGVGPETLSSVDIFFAYAITQLILLIPITPGGMGVAEASYIYFLNLASSGAVPNEVGAAVLLFRVVTWLYVVPAGFATWGLWRLSLNSDKYKSL